MSAGELVDDDAEPQQPAPIDARRLAEWVIVAGLVLGFAAAGFLIWEAWSANRAALDHNRRVDGEAQVFAFGAGSEDLASSRPGPPPGGGPSEGYETS